MGLKRQTQAGIATFFLFFYLGWVEHREPFYTYYYLFAWGPFLWVIDRTLTARTGASPFSHPEDLCWLFAFSTTLWLVFEVINFRLHNWIYTGVPVQRWLRWPGYALSFATVVPGILMVRKLVESCLPEQMRSAEHGMRKVVDSSKEIPASGLRIPRSRRDSAGPSMVVIGLAMLLLPLAWPQYFFPLVWGGFFFLFEPWVQRLGGHSLLRDWRRGLWRRTSTLLASGLACGLFWEGCNFGAGSKWHYTLPYWGFGKFFEMPAPGFIGFLPFALEVHSMHQVAVRLWQRWNRAQRTLAIGVMLLFWWTAFYGIDRWTVAAWQQGKG